MEMRDDFFQSKQRGKFQFLFNICIKESRKSIRKCEVKRGWWILWMGGRRMRKKWNFFIKTNLSSNKLWNKKNYFSSSLCCHESVWEEKKMKILYLTFIPAIPLILLLVDFPFLFYFLLVFDVWGVERRFLGNRDDFEWNLELYVNNILNLVLFLNLITNS